MDETVRDALRQKLDRRAAQLRDLLSRPAHDTSTVAPDKAIGRLTRMEAMQAGYMAEALRREARQELARIDRVLGTIDTEAFGHCRRCGEPLPVARLEAKPDAQLCVPCASAGERAR